MIDLNHKTNTISKQEDEPVGAIILALLPFVIAFWALIEIYL